MIALLSQKRIKDGHGQALDALETAYAAFFAALGLTPVPVPNAPQAAQRLLRDLTPGLVVLTGGNDVDPAMARSDATGLDVVPERDAVERLLLDAASATGTPVLGICRGMQFLNAVMGGSVLHAAASGPAHAPGRPHACLALGREHTVNSFHDHWITAAELAPGLQPVAAGPDGIIEAVAGRLGKAPVLGVQWHPERPQADAALFLDLVRRFLGLDWGLDKSPIPEAAP